MKVSILALIDRMREAAGSMDEICLLCQAGISSSGYYFLVITGE